MNSIKGNNNIRFNAIDNQSDPIVISNIFKDKLCSVFDDGSSQHNFCNINDISGYDDSNSSNNIRVTFSDLKKCIADLNCGIGFDRIHSNHLKFANEAVSSFLCKYFSLLFSHSFVPKDLTHGVFKPIIKNKCGDKCSSDNYSPIMVSSSIFKLIEMVLYPKIDSCLRLDIRQ